MTYDLFQSTGDHDSWVEHIDTDAVILRQFAALQSEALFETTQHIARLAPFRQMQTPGGHKMSVTTTSCGHWGWVSDHKGYRYSAVDPQTNQPWPVMPDLFKQLATEAATKAGFFHFEPDACLMNRYQPGAKMGLHQDNDERDLTAPIVSVSLGVPATFVFGGMHRTGKTVKIPLGHGDVVVWGGKARLHFHGVLTVRSAYHLLTGNERINLTFRKAG